MIRSQEDHALSETDLQEILNIVKDLATKIMPAK